MPFANFPVGMPLLHVMSLVELIFSKIVTSSPQVGWSPVLAMMVRSSSLKGLSDNVRTGFSLTDIVAAVVVAGNVLIGSVGKCITRSVIFVGTQS